ncbi:unnamed protein product [Fusarium venenatum]|uniref:Uncharacterized protein n=1 Tax=Fusarium venenatum TaxID=56646 RepID=A0A2L2THI3_9HYPO|nr:uncharacterized protein FVRRES_09536 [Fusarium venenatum]CEI69459.1 unnamed protein product [Fusarium venenatum]
MDDRFADPPTPTLEQGTIFQNPATNMTGTTGRLERPAPIPSGPGWPVDENSQDAKYLTLISKLENLEAGHRLILDDIATLSHRVSKITEVINMSYESRTSTIESPKASFSKSLNTAKVPSVKVEKLEAEPSPAKIIIPRTTKVAHFEIRFGSPDQVVKERDPKSSDKPSANVGLTLPEETPTKSAPVPLSVASACTTSLEESEEQNVEMLPQPDYHVEESAPERSGESSSSSLSSEESELLRQGQDEDNEASRLVVQRLANNHALFGYFVRYLRNPNTSFTRQIATEPDETAHLLARSFQDAVRQPKQTAPIARPEFFEIRATVSKMGSSTRVDLYIELSQRYRRTYGMGN